MPLKNKLALMLIFIAVLRLFAPEGTVVTPPPTPWEGETYVLIVSETGGDDVADKLTPDQSAIINGLGTRQWAERNGYKLKVADPDAVLGPSEALWRPLFSETTQTPYVVIQARRREARPLPDAVTLSFLDEMYKEACK